MPFLANLLLLVSSVGTLGLVFAPRSRNPEEFLDGIPALRGLAARVRQILAA